MPGHRRRGGHRGAHQMRSAALALAALEVAVRGRGAALAGLELVGVHGEAHRAMPWRRCSSAISAGLGTVPVIGSTSSGLVPQVTCGTIVVASITTSLS